MGWLHKLFFNVFQVSQAALVDFGLMEPANESAKAVYIVVKTWDYILGQF